MGDWRFLLPPLEEDERLDFPLELPLALLPLLLLLVLGRRQDVGEFDKRPMELAMEPPGLMDWITPPPAERAATSGGN